VETDAHVQPVIASFPNPLGYRRQTLNTKPKSRRCERSAAAQEPEFEVMDGRASLAMTQPMDCRASLAMTQPMDCRASLAATARLRFTLGNCRHNEGY